MMVLAYSGTCKKHNFAKLCHGVEMNKKWEYGSYFLSSEIIQKLLRIHPLALP